MAKALLINLKDESTGQRDKVCVELADVEQALCLRCSRGVVGICPYRGKEPGNPEKTVVCETLNALRGLKTYVVKVEQSGSEG